MRNLLMVLTLAAACSANSAQAQQRPQFTITTNARYDASTVAPYAASHADVYAHIEANLPAHVANLQRWVRQPSVSAQNRGIQEMATMLRDDLTKIGFREATLVPTSGHPGVFGFLDANAPKTLVIYMMYDVQPVEPEGWRVNAFDGAIVDHALGRVLMARGATNQKGPERAFLNALESIIATRGKLPINLLLLAEGEEELGSPNYPEVIGKYADRLRRTNGVFFPFNGQGATGRVTMSLGVKGITYFELEARGDSMRGPRTAEIHGSYKALVDAPAWRLTQALSTLVSKDGNTILVPGYYNSIRQPNDEEQRLVNGMLASGRATRRGSVHRSASTAGSRDGAVRSRCCNICSTPRSTSTACGAATRGPEPRRFCRTWRPRSWTRGSCPTRRRTKRCG